MSFRYNMNPDFHHICQHPDELFSLIRERLSDHKSRTIRYKEVEERPAAILIPLFFKDGEAHVLFTKRTDTVEHHKGQISFPGGMRDEEDSDMRDTALRETWEEMGIRPEDVEILGSFDRFLTITDFMITPYVGTFPYPYEFVLSDGEIDRVIEVPLIELLEPDQFEIKPLVRDGIRWDVHYYTHNGDTIWGVTGMLVSNFLSIVFDLDRIRFGESIPG